MTAARCLARNASDVNKALTIVKYVRLLLVRILHSRQGIQWEFESDSGPERV